jgi:hypothetical protein
VSRSTTREDQWGKPEVRVCLCLNDLESRNSFLFSPRIQPYLPSLNLGPFHFYLLHTSSWHTKYSLPPQLPFDFYLTLPRGVASSVLDFFKPSLCLRASHSDASAVRRCHLFLAHFRSAFVRIKQLPNDIAVVLGFGYTKSSVAITIPSCLTV